MQPDDFCYLTTTGRTTGKPHRIEIWFAREGSTVYVLAGAGPDRIERHQRAADVLSRNADRLEHEQLRARQVGVLHRRYDLADHAGQLHVRFRSP